MDEEKRMSYLLGFGNDFVSEAIPDSLPKCGNNPKFAPRGLYAEQLSGTAFTVPRKTQQRSWLYRISPSVSNTSKKPLNEPPEYLVSDFSTCQVDPNQRRWTAFDFTFLKKPTNFVHGLHTMCGSGSVATKSGFGIHIYLANADMEDCSFTNSDGDFLIVPQEGRLDITTEFGRLMVTPGEICVIPRGILYSIALPDQQARGYILEIYESHFTLPELGPIGANGLANLRDFQYPVAHYEDRSCTYTCLHKFQGKLFASENTHSPFDVVAWHGNYLPFKYDLSKFCPVNAVAFDHSDPSIFTVLTAPSSVQGLAVADFVIFPPRWLVQEDTFRPPYFHRNCMNEFMGLIKGGYDAKATFKPGSSSLHMCMTPHGPDKKTFDANQKQEKDEPVKLSILSMAFMFETNFTPLLTPFALSTEFQETDYMECWKGFERNFQKHLNNQVDGNDSV